MHRVALLTAALLLAVTPAAAQDAKADTEAPTACRKLTHERVGYVVCETDLRRQTIKLFWKQPNGRRYGTLLNFATKSRPREGRMLFAMNAGMYRPDRSPLGLYVENGSELAAANTNAGSGNFFLKPNGVFYIDVGQAGVVETERFLKQGRHSTLATQSGPMLVIDGKLHPAISEHGVSRNVRNGVGVRDPHRVVFAISTAPVTFGAFARLFRDRLGCANALYLDGRVSGLYAPKVLHKNVVSPVGPIIGVFERK